MTLVLDVQHISAKHLPSLMELERLLDEPCDVHELISNEFTTGRIAWNEQDGALGYVVWSTDCPCDREIQRFVVSPKFRRNRVGSILLASMENPAPPVEAVSCSVHVVRADFTRFLAASGYELTGTYERNGMNYARMIKWLTR